MIEIRSAICMLESRKGIPQLLTLMDAHSIAEVGVYRGTFFKQLIKPQCVQLALAVDAWDASLLIPGGSTPVDQKEMDYMYNSLKSLALKTARPNIGVWRGDSATLAGDVEDGTLDFVYIDADHTYKGCLRDLLAWYPKLREGGVFCGHDYFKEFYYTKYGVIEAVNDFRKSKKLKFFYATRENCPNWFVVKGL